MTKRGSSKKNKLKLLAFIKEEEKEVKDKEPDKKSSKKIENNTSKLDQ